MKVIRDEETGERIIKRIYVLTSRSALSRELMYVADKPIFYLEEFRDVLVRDHRARRSEAEPDG